MNIVNLIAQRIEFIHINSGKKPKKLFVTQTEMDFLKGQAGNDCASKDGDIKVCGVVILPERNTNEPE